MEVSEDDLTDAPNIDGVDVIITVIHVNKALKLSRGEQMKM